MRGRVELVFMIQGFGRKDLGGPIERAPGLESARETGKYGMNFARGRSDYKAIAVAAAARRTRSGPARVAASDSNAPAPDGAALDGAGVG